MVSPDSHSSQARTHMHKQNKGGFLQEKAPKPLPEDPERRTVQNEEDEQALRGIDEKKAKAEQVGSWGCAICTDFVFSSPVSLVVKMGSWWHGLRGS